MAQSSITKFFAQGSSSKRKLPDTEDVESDQLSVSISQDYNAKYTSNTAIGEFLACINEILEQDILCELKASQHFSLMFDETTDCSVIEQLVIHCRYITESGEVRVRYCKILDALSKDSRPTGTDFDTDIDEHIITLSANTVSHKVTNFIETNGLSYEKLCGIGTDGAAVMTGAKNGAVKKIVERQTDQQKDENNPDKQLSKAVGQHCAAHKLNLAAKQAGTGFPKIRNFKRVLHSLHAFYSRSAVRTAGLASVQALLHETLDEAGKVNNPSETRWLALGECTIKLKSILTTILFSLEREAAERADSGAAGLVNLMTRLEFILTLCLLCEVLPTVNRLSLNFQKSHIDFSVIKVSLDAAVSILKDKKNFNLTQEISDIVAKLASNGLSVKYTRDNLEDEVANFRETVQRPFLDKLIDNLNARFQDTEIMKAFNLLFNPASYTSNTVQLEVFLITLCEQFAIDKARAVKELKDFEHYAKFAPDDTDFLACLSNSENAWRAMFPGLAKLARIFRVLPPHTADCERDFSKMKLVKTDLRNRMTEDTLDSLMRICLEGPPVHEFPYERAVKLWANKKDRRYKVKLH